MFYHICHLELRGFYILYVCQVVNCILGVIFYLFMHFLLGAAAKTVGFPNPKTQRIC